MVSLPPKRNGRPWGEARDRSVLIGYTSSWAARVCGTKFPDKMVPKLKHQQGRFWPLDDEHPNVIALVKASGLWSGIEALQKTYDVVTVCVFRERFWPETRTFHLPFGEMTITLDDAKKITGLSLEGKAVFEGFNNYMPFDELCVLAKHCLGWGKDEAEEEFEIGGGAAPRTKRKNSAPGELAETVNMARKINLVRLKYKFEDSDSKTNSGLVVMDAEKARHTAIAYLLHALGTVFFPDFIGNKVNACYLQ